MKYLQPDYLDLLEKTLLHSFWPEPYLDAHGRPAQDIISAKEKESGLFWPARSFTMLNRLRLRNVRDMCEQAIRCHIPGGFAECGVWRGGACIYARACLPTDRTVYVCDSFSGFPDSNPEDKAWSGYNCLSVPLATVTENFEKFGLMENVTFLAGYFEDTLPTFDAPLAVLRADADTYKGTMSILTNLWPKLSPGGFLIMDDFNNLSAPERAFKDYFGSVAPSINQIEGTAIWCRKL